MLDLLLSVSQAERNAFPTLSRLSDDDVNNIWAYVASYIEHQMSLKKGVNMAGLGTFTFSQQKLAIGNKCIVIQRPVFLLAEKLTCSQGIVQVRPLAAATNIPVVQLNYTAMSQEGPYKRDVVEGCVRDCLLLLLRALASKHNVFLTFQGIGMLSFKNSKVRMKFNRDFVNALDGTGRLLLAFTNRPGSSASLMSGRMYNLLRPPTAFPAALLPRVDSAEPAIESEGADTDRQGIAPPPDSEAACGNATAPQQRLTRMRQTLQPAKVNSVSLCEEMSQKPALEANNKCTGSLVPPEGSLRVEDPHLKSSCTDHVRAGQELCYLCMQREQRNVPIYLQKERMAEEQAQERLLLLQELHKDNLYLEKEQANRVKQREHSKQVSTFNLDISEALKQGKTKCPSFQSSFIFRDRPVTPLPRSSQRHYMEELQTQVACRRQQLEQAKQGRFLLERLEQAQLAREISLQRSQEHQQKQEKAKEYQKALDAQVDNSKGPGLPEQKPDTLGFGRIDTPTIFTEGRERAQKLFQEQLQAAAQKRTHELSKRQAQQTTEREMLNRNRRELILDRITRFEKMQSMNASLQDDWRRSSRVKSQREEEEKTFLRTGGGLLIDQCEQYRRCHQCKRRTANRGESNIWRDSHYTSGSRLMI